MSHHHSTRKHIYRTAIVSALLLGGSWLMSLSALAASPTPGTSIDNQATGSYIDDGANTPLPLQSEIVTLTVGEVAGITVTANGTTGTPNPSATVYYSFVITNVGNDATQFFIPSVASVTGNATQLSNIEITGYNLAGASPVTTSVVIPTGGGQTGSNGTVNGLLTTNGTGIIQPGGSVTVRVPVKINTSAVNNDPIVVRLGDTPDSASTTTPKAQLENQAFVAGSNDVYTVDNPDSLETSAGVPINGDATNHRQEAAALQSTLVIAGNPLSCSNIYGITSDATNTLLKTFDPITGTVSSVTTMGAAVSAFTLGIDPVSGRAYYVANAAGATQYHIFSYDPISNVTTDTGTVVPIQSGLSALQLGFDQTGLGYIVDQNFNAWSFTATTSPVVTSLGVVGGLSGYNGGDMAFDSNNSYWTVSRNTTSGNYTLFHVTKSGTTLTATKIGDLKEGGVTLSNAANIGSAAFDAAGNLYIVRSSDGHSWKVDPKTAIATTIAASITPNGNGISDFATCAIPTIAAASSITGTVFEDVNYGGGAGRKLTAAAGVVRPNARVELYNSAGAFKGFAITNAAGLYTFDSTNVTGGVIAGDYTVRVVNSTVTSSRPGSVAGLLPVQTYRTNASTGTAIIDPNRVGGEVPNLADAGNGSTTLASLTTGTTTAESIAPVKIIGTTGVASVDFGYNFDTIVNTKDSGQGSLRQFILNSNALTNATLAQVGQTAGKEVSIFMVPSGAATPGIIASIPTQLTGGVATITVTSQLPGITDTNTTIDGTTQTTNVGDTNTGITGTGLTVGTDALTLSTVNKPEVELNDGTATIVDGLVIQANNTTIRGLAIWGFGNSRTDANIQVVDNGSNNCSATTAYTGLLIEQNILGTKATGFSQANTNYTNNNGQGFRSHCGGQGTFQNNLVGFTTAFGSSWNNMNTQDANMKWLITNNEFRSGGTFDKMDNVGLEGSVKNIDFIGNLSTGAYANGVSLYDFQANANINITNNTISNSGSGASKSELAGIALFTGAGNSGITISKNVITANAGAGVWVNTDINGVKISQNSMFNNGGLGIDLVENAQNFNQTVLTTVTPNDGSITVANIGNKGLDYPIITSSVLSGTTLTVKGFVGGLGTNNAIFAGANLEFFIAAANTNDFGKVFSTGSTATKLHGEGQTYLNGTTVCTTDATGAFNCALTGVSATLDPYNITSTATLSGNTSEFSSVSSPGANVLLVKRITAINGTSITGVVHEFATGGNDRNPNWPSATHLQGAINGGKVQTNDVIEYTIYFLNTGGRDAKTARVCDDIKPNQAFQPDQYATGKGITVQMGNTATLLTNTNDPTTDRGQYIAVGGTFPTNCGLTTTNPAIVVDVAGSTGTPSLTAVPFATGAGAPLNSYGFVRFTTKVGP